MGVEPVAGQTEGDKVDQGGFARAGIAQEDQAGVAGEGSQGGEAAVGSLQVRNRFSALALHSLLPPHVMDVQVGEDGGQVQFGSLPPGGGLDVNGGHFEVGAAVHQFAQITVAQGLGGEALFRWPSRWGRLGLGRGLCRLRWAQPLIGSQYAHNDVSQESQNDD
jgi:hypothetical protein